jgi:hypothetical protein
VRVVRVRLVQPSRHGQQSHFLQERVALVRQQSVQPLLAGRRLLQHYLTMAIKAIIRLVLAALLRVVLRVRMVTLESDH